VRHGWPVDHPRGPEGEKRHRAAHAAEFRDFHITAEDIVAEGDRVAVRYRWTAVHRPTGKPVFMDGIAIHRVASGKITELWAIGDELSLHRQLAEG
jgi:ketosteroid isomerase-like protein